MPRTDPDNPYDRAPKRGRDRERKARRALLHRYSEARSVACGQVQLRYAPIPAPGNLGQLALATNPLPTIAERRARWRVPDSWEILTERGGSAG